MEAKRFLKMKLFWSGKEMFKEARNGGSSSKK